MLRPAVFTACLLAAVAVRADEHELETIEEAPKGLSPAITKLVNAEGFRITGEKGALADLWLLKDLAVEPDFKSSLSKLYAFQPGQLIGVLRIADGAEYSDFRGQAMKAGTYTLRYGLQPMDGNHVGTSETSDFLLALPFFGCQFTLSRGLTIGGNDLALPTRLTTLFRHRIKAHVDAL